MIRTNYTYQNWIELFVWAGVFLVITLTPVIIYVEFIFVPVLDGHMEFLNFLNDEGIIDKFGEKIRANIQNDDEFITALISMLSLVLAPFLLIFPIFWIIQYCMALAHWTCRKANLTPMLQLVIIRKNRGTTILRFRQ